MRRILSGSLALLIQIASPAVFAEPAPSQTATPAAAPEAASPASVDGAAPDEQAAPAAEAEELAPAAPSDIPDDPALANEMDEAARELAELRAAEAAAVDEGAKQAGQLFDALQRTGAASPYFLRLHDALDPLRPLPLVADELDVSLGAAGEFDIELAKRLYDIPVEMQPLVAEYIRFFQTGGRKHFLRWLERSGRYLPAMRKSLREAGMPEDTVYLAMIESGFSPMAYSWAKAAGIWQFIEPTGKRFGLQVDFWVDQRRDPIKATQAAIGYLKELYGEFGDWRLAWAGYNAGAGKVRRAIRDEGTTSFWDMVQGRTLRKETKHYVPKLMAAALISKNLKAFGFSEELVPHAPLAFEEVEVPEATDLEVIAKAAGVTVDEIKDLNPELRRWCTPPARTKGEVYRARVPVGTATRFAENFAQIAPKDRLTFRVHRVGRGDTLSKIAQRHGSAIEAIMRMNGLRDSRRLKLGSDLVIPVPRTGSREQLAVQARREGYRAAPADQEVPAAPRARNASGKVAAAGSTRTVKEGGKTKVVYAVAHGDSLWTIASHFGVGVEDVKRWNQLRGKRPVLQIGQELALYPADPKAAVAKDPGRTKEGAKAKAEPARQRQLVHVLAKGETLQSIAKKYRVSVEDIQRWNKLSKADAPRVGRSLTIRVPEKA